MSKYVKKFANMCNMCKYVYLCVHTSQPPAASRQLHARAGSRLCGNLYVVVGVGESVCPGKQQMRGAPPPWGKRAPLETDGCNGKSFLHVFGIQTGYSRLLKPFTANVVAQQNVAAPLHSLACMYKYV